MRLLALFACAALPFLGGCILVYDPGEFQIDGSGGDGGNGGGGQGCSPQDEIDGAPVTEAMDNQWTWISVPESKCRNNTPAGFGIRINPNSDKLFIFFDGSDGACFSDPSCAANKASFSSADFTATVSMGANIGIFNTTNADNPVADWNAVFVPYCTGDVHAGDDIGNVPMSALPSQYFYGFKNVGHYMARIVPTFKNKVDKVLVAGISAGGFGALFNYDRIARDFCPLPVVLIDDSGPPMSDSYLAPCLEDRWRILWNVEKNLPQTCTEEVMASNDIADLLKCLGSKYPQSRLGLIASDQDLNNRVFYGLGKNDCANIDTAIMDPLDAADYTAGLNQLRTDYMNSPAWGSYFVSGTNHIYLAEEMNRYYSTTVANVKLTDWIRDMLDGSKPAAHVTP